MARSRGERNEQRGEEKGRVIVLVKSEQSERDMGKDEWGESRRMRPTSAPLSIK